MKAVGDLYDLRAWYKATHERHSVREFDGLPVDEDVTTRIKELGGGFSDICAGARGHIIEGTEGTFTGFGRIVGAPLAVAILVDMDSSHPMVSGGYLGEGIVLESVAARLGTCWATSFNKATVDQKVSLRDSEAVVALIAIGRDLRTGPFDPYGAWISRGVGMALHGSRRSVDKIVSGLPREKWPQKLDYVFDATRVAPSSRNRQPWRFEVQDDGVTISVDPESAPPDPTRQLEGGIAMLHFEVATKACGISGQWWFLDPPALAKFAYED
jgi:hypothetical protein